MQLHETFVIFWRALSNVLKVLEIGVWFLAFNDYDEFLFQWIIPIDTIDQTITPTLVQQKQTKFSIFNKCFTDS